MLYNQYLKKKKKEKKKMNTHKHTQMMGFEPI